MAFVPERHALFGMEGYTPDKSAPFAVPEGS